MDKQKNPFYKHADAEFFIAERDGEMVGRIAAIINHNHIREHNEQAGFYGFFESVNDQSVANALFDHVRQYLKARGMAVMRGPANPSVNDDWGLLFEGFQYPPAMLMPYNPPYYVQLTEAYGFNKAKDMYAFKLTQDRVYTEKMDRVYKLIRERHSMVFRSLNMKRFSKEVQLIKEIFNKAWQKNWGAVPMTNEEIEALAADLKPVVEPDLVIFAEINGQTIGFALALPDINMVLKNNKKGRLLPGLYQLFFNKKKIDGVRIIVLGVLPEYQRTGAAGMLFYETALRAKKLGYMWGEASWVLEDNIPMVRAAEAMSAELYKKYRVYEYSL